jgi:hypothetical protein
MSPNRFDLRGPVTCACGNEFTMTFRHQRRLFLAGKPIRCPVCSGQRTANKCGTTGIVTPGMKATEHRETLQVNGCTLQAHYRGRCQDYLVCSGYDECLAAVAGKNWSGFSATRTVA